MKIEIEIEATCSNCKYAKISELEVGASRLYCNLHEDTRYEFDECEHLSVDWSTLIDALTKANYTGVEL